MKFEVKESENIMFMPTQNNVVIPKQASGLVLGTNDFTENKVLFFTGSFRPFFFFFPFFLFVVSTFLFLFLLPILQPPFPSSLCKTKHKSGVVRIGTLCCQGNIKRKSYVVPEKKAKGRQRLANIARSNGAATCNSKAVNL